MSDTVTEVTRQSWGHRLKGSVKGILGGLLLFGASFFVLFWNEGRSVRRYKALAEGARDVVSVNADRVLQANEGALVHLSGPANTSETLEDPDFGVAVQAIHLYRNVAMYQWQESSESRTEKKAGGSTETTTTYSYKKVWSGRLIDSSRFHRPSGHTNPPSMPYRSYRISANRVTLGAFDLGAGLIDRITHSTELPFRTTDGLPPRVRSGARVVDGDLYLGDPRSPEVGDVRIGFRYVPPMVVSVVARQSGSRLLPYETRSGDTLALLRVGTLTAEEMFVAAHEANKVLTWILRGLGFLMMLVGLRLILAPIGVMADVWPLLGNIVAKGVTLLAAAIALPLSLVTIALAWLFYRPLLGIALLVLAALALWGLVRLVRRRSRSVKSEPPAGPPTAPSSGTSEPVLPPLPTGD